MRYANGSNGNYGKVNFICDTSKYEVVKVERYFSNTSSSNYGSADKVYEGTIPSDLSVQFTSNNSYYYYTPTHEHYKFIAYVQAKTIHVKYDANSGTGDLKGTTVKSTEKVTVDSTTRPTREGYIFTGWAYGGKLYQGGESFDAPISDVTFVAQWAKASDVINYTVNDSDMGSVSRSYERIGETVQGNVQGSTAIAKTGYRFVKWVEGTNSEGKAISTDVLFKPTAKGTYMAVFEAVTSDLVVRYVDTAGKDISDRKTKSYKYGESYTEKAKEITGYRLTSDATITGTKGAAGEEIKFIYEAIPVIVTIKGKTDSKEYTGNPQKVEGYDIESIKDDKGNSISGYSKKDVALAEGKTAVATGTDVGTYNMGLTTESFVNTNKSFKNVTFVVQDGSMTITQNTAEVTVTITGSEETKEYNGSEQTLEGFQSTVSGAEKAQIQVSLKAGKTAQAKGTNVGKYSMNLKAEDFEATSDNYSNIKVVVAKDGTLTIDKAKAKVTVKGNKDSKPYNGKNQSVSGYSLVSIDNDLYKESYFTLKEGKGTATRKNAGTTPMGLKSEDFQNRNDNFDVEFVVSEDGSMTITQNTAEVTVTITGSEETKEYNGSEQTLEGFQSTVSGAEKAQIQVSLKAGKTAQAKGTNVGKYSMNLKAEDFEATSDNYSNIKVVVAKDGTLTIDKAKAKVTVKGNKDSKPYNGKNQSVSGYSLVSIDNDLYKESYFTLKEGKGTATRKNAGTTPMGLKSEDFQNRNDNFDVEFVVSEDGSMTITQKSIIPDGPKTPEEKKTGIKVTAPKDTTYSGNEQKKEPVIEDTKTGKTLDKDDYSLSYSDDVTNAGTVTITVTGKGNYTGKFEVTYKINPRKVTLKSETASKPYDGTALTKPAVKVSGDGFVEGEVSDIKATGSVTTVSEGEVTNTITFTKENNYKDGNYKIEKDEGKLSITAQSIDPGTDPEKPNPDYTGAKVNSPSDEVYDGNEHKWIPTVTDKADKKLKAGTDYTVEYSTKNFKDVGTIDVTITGKGNYTGTVTRTYKITPKSVTVTAEDKTKVFGETDPKLTAKVAGTLGNDTVEYTLSRETGEAAGKYEITVKGDKLQGNYKVTYVAGTLTITSQSIDPGTDPEKPNPDYTGAKVNSPKDSVYDGKEHKWIPTVTDKADKKLEAGKDYTVEYSTKNFKDVGTIKVTITGIGNYSGTVKRSYKVTPKEYTVTTESATKTYSGTALTAGGKVEGIVSGETVEFTTTGSQTEVGTSKNTYELVWKSAKATNYTLAKESIGKLTVKAKSIVPDDKDTPDSDKTGITVSEPSDSMYDGKEHKEVLTVTDTKTGKELVAGTDYSVTYSSDLVNAGTVKVTVAGLGNYTGSFTKTYKITKRSVTLTSATVSKVYDGSALTNTSITVSGDGFVEGEGASYEVTGTQTEVGNSANAFEYKLNEKTLASNYNITKVVGTLTITAAPAPVTPATPSTPSTPSSTTSTTPRTPSAPQVTTPAETVEKETTPKAEPKKEEKVEEEYTPKASPQYYWALINLICAILTVLFGLLLLISKRHKDEDDDEEDDETKQQTTNDDEEKEQEKKRGLFTRVLAVLIAIVSVVFFLVTEDLSLPWTWTDQWTIWMAVIGLVQIVVFFVGRKWKNVDNDDDDEEAQQA